MNTYLKRLVIKVCWPSRPVKWWVGGLFLATVVVWNCPAAESEITATTNSFPTVPEVLGGRTFDNFTAQDVFFLQSIHDRYHDHWSDLLEANLTLSDFVLAPAKQLRFVNELGEAMRGRNDPEACVRLAQITGDPAFYANTNVSRPEILQAAARALIRIGPVGRQALASTFTVDHYRSDPASLEVLADAVGEERPDDAEFRAALAAVAFSFCTTNGAFYPHCVAGAVKNLLGLTNGLAAVQTHLKIEEVLANPGLFQAVVEGVAGAEASGLSTNLTSLQVDVRKKLVALADSPGGYRDELQELDAGISRACVSLGKK